MKSYLGFDEFAKAAADFLGPEAHSASERGYQIPEAGPALIDGKAILIGRHKQVEGSLIEVFNYDNLSMNACWYFPDDEDGYDRAMVTFKGLVKANPVKESKMPNMILEISKSAMVQRLMGADSNKVKDAFAANYLAALIMIKLQDLKGLMLVNDRAHARLTGFADGMSDLNFWARALFYPNDTLVRKHLQFGHADVLAKEAGRMLDSRVLKMMQVPLTAPEAINWPETVASLILLQHRFGIRSSYFVRVGQALQKWDSLPDSAKRKAVGDVFLYLMQADPRSNLLSRIRELSGTSMLRDLTALAQHIVSFKRINEDEAVSTANVASGGGMPIFGQGANAMITPVKDVNGNNPALDNAYGFKKNDELDKGDKLNKMKIKKRVRKFKLIKFKVPAHLKGE